MPIFTGLAPNLNQKDVRIAAAFLFFPWKWSLLQRGNEVKKVEQWFERRFQAQYAVTFDSGRSALQAALKAARIGEGDVVLIPGYTCIVVANAVTQLGAKPVYVDITSTLQMDLDVLDTFFSSSKKQNIKAIIVQHTFGVPEQIEKLREIANKYNLVLIEDVAHTIGGSFKGRALGSWGDISIFSFGSEKVVSCGRGGVAITNNFQYGNQLRQAQEALPQMSIRVVVQYLISFLLFFLAKPWYFQHSIGKFFLAIAKKLHLIPSIISSREKIGERQPEYPTAFPNALATVVFPQLLDIDANNVHRKKISQIYVSQLPKEIQLPFDQDLLEVSVFLQFPIVVDKPFSLRTHLLQFGIQLSTAWSGSPVAPKDVSLQVAQYEQEKCSSALNISSRVLLLPTHRNISEVDAESICFHINQYLLDVT